MDYINPNATCTHRNRGFINWAVTCVCRTVTCIYPKAKFIYLNDGYINPKAEIIIHQGTAMLSYN